MEIVGAAAEGPTSDLASWLSLTQTILWVAAVIAIVVIFKRQIVIFRDELAKRLERGSSVKLGVLELGQRVDRVESSLARLNDRVIRAFLLAISDQMFANLAKLADGRFGGFERSKGLERELHRLRDIGHVEIASVNSLPLHGENLSEYVAVTPRGREFVALRRELDAMSVVGSVVSDLH